MLERFLPGSLVNAADGDADDVGGGVLSTSDDNGGEPTRCACPTWTNRIQQPPSSPCCSTISRLEGDQPASERSDVDKLHFVFAVPGSYPPIAREALVDAAYAAGIQSSSVVDSAACLAAVYEKKFGDVEDEEDKVVLVVEVGHARTCVSMLKKKAAAKAEEEDAAEAAEGSGANVEVLSSVSSPTLGAALIDIALYPHFLSTHPGLSHHSADAFKDNSCAAQRLLTGCNKLKHLLSMLPENKVVVGNIGKNDTDVSLSADRKLLVKLCQESRSQQAAHALYQVQNVFTSEV